MSNQFSPEISSRICKHMNEDHADAVVMYIQAFSDIKNAKTAQMLSIYADGMNLTAHVNGGTVPVHIQLDHVLTDAEYAHQTLIGIVKQPRQRQSRNYGKE
jgi:putative heme iron utilization protein